MIVGPFGPVTTVASGSIVGALEIPAAILFAVAMDTTDLSDTLVYVFALKCEFLVPFGVSGPDRGAAVWLVSTTPTPNTADRHHSYRQYQKDENSPRPHTSIKNLQVSEFCCKLSTPQR